MKKAHYFGETGRILEQDDHFVLVQFPDGDQYRFPKDIVGLEFPSDCHTFSLESVTPRCAVCHRPLSHRHRQTKTCSSRCRKALSRRNH